MTGSFRMAIFCNNVLIILSLFITDANILFINILKHSNRAEQIKRYNMGKEVENLEMLIFHERKKLAHNAILQV